MTAEEATAFVLRADHIALDALLKAAGIASSGGAAKTLVVAGRVRVDGHVETRRGCKLRAGQDVEVEGRRIRLVAADPAEGATPQPGP